MLCKESCVELFFINREKFQPINGNYGHAYGDLQLRELNMTV